ncbi:MAG: helix-turn-helix domain-containing protein [Christensenellaceae bacterium]|jgi:transcriptional regulator with XRE-family HTH domain|nr:helix-turn-helix domain-containing protein [Christensenellaceae bacterium]
MKIADRIQILRKSKGISQEELADKIGVSRQAVSKWESEQSVPDMDRVIIMSDYFEVTTDYILKGIENEKQANERAVNAAIFVITATVLNFIGLVVSSAIWYEKQAAMAVGIGLIFLAMGCMIFGIGMAAGPVRGKEKAKRAFWTVNIWMLAFIPLSLVYNVLFTGFAAPYPIPAGTRIAFPVFWLVYIAICLGVVLAQVKTARK